MSFAISQIIQRENKSLLALDGAAILTLTVILALMLSRVININIPMGIGTIGNSVILATFGLLALLAIADVIAFVKATAKDPIDPLTIKKAEIRKLILEAQIDHFANVGAAIATPAHQIFENLFLGRDYSFAQTTYCHDIRNEYGEKINCANPNNIKTVITVCPVFVMNEYCTGLSDNQVLFESQFKRNNINWHYIGKSLMDANERGCWLDLVTHCTFTSEDEADKSLPEDRKEWFKPIFQEIDKAVFGDVRTLVHCQAGMSRSATLLAAYLINRFNVTTDQALTFLTAKRPCVASKFGAYLKEYENRLRPS